MSSPSVEVPVDEVVIALPRRRGPKSYSAHNGVARTPAPAEVEAPRPRLSSRRRARSTHPADVAQSELFEAILLAEIDDLEDRAAAVERRRHRRSTRKADGVDNPPPELRELRHRITEARQLLDALRQRFPRD